MCFFWLVLRFWRSFPFSQHETGKARAIRIASVFRFGMEWYLAEGATLLDSKQNGWKSYRAETTSHLTIETGHAFTCESDEEKRIS